MVTLLMPVYGKAAKAKAVPMNPTIPFNLNISGLIILPGFIFKRIETINPKTEAKT